VKQLYIIGDSISIEYGPSVEKSLPSAVSYARKKGLSEAMANLDIPTGANDGDSSMVLAYLQSLCADESFRPDILAINAGLHDLRKNPQDGSYQNSLKQYRLNIRAIAELCAERGTRLVWIRTTPIDDAMAARNHSFTRCRPMSIVSMRWPTKRWQRCPWGRRIFTQ
jgi:lysophospholipase L1-like esterase